jgi:hypothetical protein
VIARRGHDEDASPGGVIERLQKRTLCPRRRLQQGETEVNHLRAGFYTGESRASEFLGLGARRIQMPSDRFGKKDGMDEECAVWANGWGDRPAFGA